MNSIRNHLSLCRYSRNRNPLLPQTSFLTPLFVPSRTPQLWYYRTISTTTNFNPFSTNTNTNNRTISTTTNFNSSSSTNTNNPTTTPLTALSIACASLLLGCGTTASLSSSSPTTTKNHRIQTDTDTYERLGTVLGEGSFGSVELGKRQSDSSFVAIKTIYETRDNDEKDSLQRELSALKEIVNKGGHPTLLSLYDVVSGNGLPLEIITELCSGGELFDKVVKEGRLEEKQASSIVKDLAAGLLFLHDTCHYSHGDIKPENIMLHVGRPKLVDFGSSHRLKPNPAQFGTSAYWSPEAHQHSPFGRRFLGGSSSDMFALGIIYYIILIGCHPFDPLGTATDQELRRNIVNGTYKWPQKNQLPHISKGVKDIVDHLLLTDQKDRYTAAHLHNALQEQMNEWNKETKNKETKNQRDPQIDSTTPNNQIEEVCMQPALRRRSALVRSIVEKSPEDGHQGNGKELSSLTPLLLDLKKCQYSSGEIIIQEGAVDENVWYLLLEGLVHVELKTTTPTNASTTDVIVAQLRAGSFFGEASILNNRPRAATVRAVTPVEVVQLTSADLDLLQLDATSTEYMNKLTKERSQARLVSLLKNAHDCATVELNENEVLFVEGDEANHVYLVLSGSIDIIDKKKQNILVTLKKGSLLGETAILTQLPRNATARASGGGGGGGGSRKTTLLKIGRRRFMNLIGTQLRQDLMANKQESLIRSMAQANVEGSTE